MVIKSTTDYSIFKISACNSDIKAEHVRRLVASIELKNMLHLRPILINQMMEVVDGQHRLRAAQQLGVPIYYEIDESLKEEDMALLNSNSRVWKFEDYLKHFVARGFEEYRKLQDFLDKNNILLFRYFALAGIKGGKLLRRFKAGTFVFFSQEDQTRFEGRLKSVVEILEFFKNYSLGGKRFLESLGMERALFRLVSLEEFSIRVFILKIELLFDKLRKCTSPDGYFEMLIEIYNWKNKNKISIQ